MAATRAAPWPAAASRSATTSDRAGAVVVLDSVGAPTTGAICVGGLRHRCVKVNTPHAHSPLQKVVIFRAAADARSDAALEMAAGSRRVSASSASRIPLRYAAMASASWAGVEEPTAARIASSSTSAEACARVRAATVIGSSHRGGASKNGRRSRAIASVAVTATLHASAPPAVFCSVGACERCRFR